MKNTRILRRELDVWKLAWQQIETFLERIDGARDQDGPHRRKLDALLRVARAVEHERAARVDNRPLSDPVIDAMPTHWYSEENGTEPISGTSDAWSLDFRKWRIPGMDEVELAVGNLTAEDGSEQVLLLHDQEIFEVRVEKTDRRFPQSADGLFMVHLPSYPRDPSDKSIVGESFILGNIEEDENTSSLFSRKAREKATLGSGLLLMLQPGQGNGQGDEDDPVRTWSDLCQTRRSNLPSDSQYDLEVKYTGPAAGPHWKMSLIAEARGVIQDVRSGLAAASSTSSQILTRIQAAASAAAAAAESDAQDVNLAADVIEEEGAKEANFPGQLRGLADTLGNRPSAFRSVASAAVRLAGALSSTQRANELEQALNTLEASLVSHSLSMQVVEAGPLQAEINDTVQGRVSYPDGTLRILRALEWGFLTSWPDRLRWFGTRHLFVLEPLLLRFRKPFTDGLRALVNGGYTGLTCQGLELSQPAPVGSDTLVSDQPASMLLTLEDMVETGQVGILEGARPTAVVILGLDTSNNKTALKISPLVVSVEREGGGSPGSVAGGQPILCVAPNLTEDELRTGESAAGPAADGHLHQTVALWSQMCLVFGWLNVEEELRGNPSLTGSQFGNRFIPDPSTLPLHDLNLHGEIPAYTTTLVIQGVPDVYWDRSASPSQPLIARPREMLLLRGRSESEDAEPGRMVQCAVEVEMVYSVTGSMLDRMDTSAAALLSTSPLADAGDGTPRLVCGPEEEIAVVVLRQTWQRKKLVGEITLRRDFAGFEAPSLASERLLPVSFLQKIMDPDSIIDDGGVDRHQEFEAAVKLMAGWTRYANES